MSELEREENLESDDKEESAAVQVAAPALSKKYVVLGFVMGVFLAALYLVCIAVLSNKLQAAEELVRYYKMRQFGIITRSSAPRELLDFYCASSIGIRRCFLRRHPCRWLLQILNCIVRMKELQSFS